MRAWSYCAITLLCVSCAATPQEQNNLGNALSAQGQHEDALLAYQAAQLAQPDEALYYFNSALSWAADGQFEVAIAALEQAIVRGDDSLKAAAYYNMGNLYFEQADYEAAISAYQQAILLRSNFEDARFNLELALLRREQPTPTPMEMNTRPEEQNADTSATPSPNPSGLSAPTPSPTPAAAGEGDPISGGEEGGEAGRGNETLVPRAQGNVDIETARRLLDELRQDAPGIGGLRPTQSVQPVTPTWKDW